MKLSILQIVTRGAAPGERPCDNCREWGRELREVRIPYGQRAAYWRDLCPECRSRLRVLPDLPIQAGAQDKPKVDAAWEKALARCRETHT